MNGNPHEIGRFALGLKALRQSDGNLEYQQLQTLNEGIPVEIIIMQLRAFIKSIEKDYFSAFDKGV